MDKHPDEPILTYFTHIQQLLHTNHIEEARQVVHQMELAFSDHAAVYLASARIAQQEGNSFAEWMWLWRGLERYPDQPELQRQMLLVQERNQRVDTPLRILHGTMEIANQMQTLSSGLQEAGFISYTLNYYPAYLQYAADYSWNLSNQRTNPAMNEQLPKLTVQLIPQFDVFHFNFNTSLTFDHSDLPMLQEANKTVVMHHWGSEVRQLSIAQKLNPYVAVKTTNERFIKEKLQRISQYIRHCIVADQELYQYVKGFYEHVHFVPVMVDLDQYQPIQHSVPNPRPLIVHAPTSPEVKGTRIILETIEKLKLTYDFDFQLIRGMSHEEARVWYQKADLIIDQILIGCYGLLSVEAMAMGKPVVCWISEFMREHYPKELPLIAANPHTLMETLEHLLKNQESLPIFGRQGRAYVERYHSQKINSQIIAHIYRSIGG